jgi:hypothetical protein
VRRPLERLSGPFPQRAGSAAPTPTSRVGRGLAGIPSRAGPPRRAGTRLRRDISRATELRHTAGGVSHSTARAWLSASLTVHRDNSRTQGPDRRAYALSSSGPDTPRPPRSLAVPSELTPYVPSEAAAVRIEDYAESLRGHPVLHVVGKGDKPATTPIAVPVPRVLEACPGGRIGGTHIRVPVRRNPRLRRVNYLSATPEQRAHQGASLRL